LEYEPKATGTNEEEEDEGEQFDFDSGDEIPEADRQALVPPPPGPGNNVEHQEGNATGADNLENSEKLRTSEAAAGGAPAKPLLSIKVKNIGNEDNQAKREDDALAKWVADPANTAWMENPDEVIYDDVPRENSDSEPEEMIYDDVENGDDGGNSSLEYGWSSSEFESYEEQSDSECKNGIPSSFLRGNHKRHLSHDLTRLKEHYEKKMKDLMANTVAAVEIQQLKQKHELKMQKLMRAAREGTKDGLERTKAAVKKGRSFIRTKSFISQDHRSSCLEEEELNLFIDVDCVHTEAIMTPMPEGLSQQQVVSFWKYGLLPLFPPLLLYVSGSQVPCSSNILVFDIN
ncbi:PREDICTED: rho guanine nucleotide exchange factor 10-like, partial [Leptosomus discolor]|uniref:rho guanine nucleotide exchange factor 10-like n=1 Tax=Leptosomus discolor TaxID=188344 RepID=UPI0005227108